MRRFSVLGFLFVVMFSLTSCNTTASLKTLQAPDGKQIHIAKCGHSSSPCLEKATATCEGGTYQVISSESHAGGLIADIIPGDSGPATWYSMTFSCGESDGKLPTFPFHGPEIKPVSEFLPGANSQQKSTPPNSNRICVTNPSTGAYVECIHLMADGRCAHYGPPCR